MYKVLVCDDEKDIVSAISIYLTSDGYEVIPARNGLEALDIVKHNDVHLVLMDIMMPVMDGIEAMVEIRKISNVPVILLTAKSEDTDKVLGLTVGADDYVTKPFRLQELLSRIRALLRRSELADKPTESGGISLERSSMTVRKNGENVFVTPTEYQILSMLMHGRGVTVTRTLLLQNIWDDNGSFIDDNTLSVHISRLREKIGAEHIVTVRGIGYRWEDGNE